MAKSNKDINNLILNFINLNPLCSSKEIHEDLKNDFAYATIKRAIQFLLAENLITVSGRGKSTKYEISQAFEQYFTNTFFQRYNTLSTNSTTEAELRGII